MTITTEPVDREFLKGLGERLRVLRERRDWSLQHVESMSGLEFKSSVVGAYERGERQIGADRLHRILGFYGASMADVWPDPRQIPYTLAARSQVEVAVKNVEAAAEELRVMLTGMED